MENNKGTITLPASKSIGARYLVASYFAGVLRECKKFDDCDDLQVIQRALSEMDVCNGMPKEGCVTIDIHASGTAFRFITAVAASTAGADFIITGTPRLCSRPMGPLLDVLRGAGADITPLGAGGSGPYKVAGHRLKGGEFEIRGDVSSQFVSALMLVAPTWDGGLKLRFSTPLVSRPYVEMTAGIMRRCGISVSLKENCVAVEAGKYEMPAGFEVESDWSAAGFFYEAAAMMSRPLTIGGLTSPERSLQGDAATARFFSEFGVESEFFDGYAKVERRRDAPGAIEADLSHNPDLAPAFAVACAMESCWFRFTGVRNLRLKECDRLAAIQAELAKLGFMVEVGDDSIEWRGGRLPVQGTAAIETYDDHRIAMAFAMAALRLPAIRILHPGVVDKSFSDFWEKLPLLGLSCHKEGDEMTVSVAGE